MQRLVKGAHCELCKSVVSYAPLAVPGFHSLLVLHGGSNFLRDR